MVCVTSYAEFRIRWKVMFHAYVQKSNIKQRAKISLVLTRNISLQMIHFWNNGGNCAQIGLDSTQEFRHAMSVV